MNILIVGGGNSTHSLIPLLSKPNNKISLLSRNPKDWKREIAMQFRNKSDEIIATLKGTLDKVSDSIEDLVPEADIIILSLPVCQYRKHIDLIAPHINRDKEVFIGTIYGQGGYNWMIENAKKRYYLDKLVYFASGLLPWIARTIKYGEIGVNYGCKKVNVAAVYPKEKFQILKSILLDDLCYKFFKKGEYVQADNFLSLTLSVDNQIIHQTRMYSLFLTEGGTWKKEEAIPYFYRDYDEASANVLSQLDEEYTLIRERIKEFNPNGDYTYMLNYLDLERLSYGSANTNIKESFTKSETLGNIKTPTIYKDGEYRFDPTHRFFKDDIYYGIAIAKWIAEKSNIPTPTIDKIIKWAEAIMKSPILNKENKLIARSTSDNYIYGTPDVYGFKNFDEIID